MTSSHPITSRQIEGENMEAVADIIHLGFNVSEDSDCSHNIKRLLLLERKVMTNLTA